MFKDKMVTPAIPERVYTMCKIVENGSMASKELREKMEPGFLKNGTTYYSAYRRAAEELGLVTVSDNIVSLSVDPTTIASIKSMRSFVNKKLEEFRDGQFYKVTKAYFDMDKEILRGEKNVAEMRGLFTKMIGDDIDAPAMHAWRFWATFLGFGYLHDMFVIPNANVFLWDIIQTSNFIRNKIYSISEFMNALRPMCNIIIDTNPSNKILNYGVSCGLRTLHDAGYIRLEHILDQDDIWNLDPMKAHSLSGTISNITILKGVEQ